MPPLARIVSGFGVLGQTLDAAGLAGVALIVGGVVVINAFSKSVVD